jgi:uncharacterized protein (TIGR02118 family)
MIKLTILFDEPGDIGAFDTYYDETHAPLVQRIPGLERFEIVRYSAGPDGAAPLYHQICGLYFADAATMRVALESREGRVTTADVENFPGNPVRTLIVGEVR